MDSRAWLLDSVSIKAWTTSNFHHLLNSWCLESRSIRAWSIWSFLMVYKVWLSQKHLTRAWSMWSFQQDCSNWPLEQTSRRVCRRQFFHQASNPWPLKTHAAKTLRIFSFPLVFNAFLWGTYSIRSCKRSTFQSSKPWSLVKLSMKLWKIFQLLWRICTWGTNLENLCVGVKKEGWKLLH